MNPKIKQFILPLIWPRAGYWIAKMLVGGGVAILVSPWWLPLIEAYLQKHLGLDNGANSTVIGFILILLGLGVYIFERRSDFLNDSMPDLTVFAHFGFFLNPPKKEEQCFVKIANSSPTKPVTVTHVDYVGSKTIHILTVPLPKTLNPSEMFEAYIPISKLPDPKDIAILGNFKITDAIGRKFTSEENKDISQVGYMG